MSIGIKCTTYCEMVSRIQNVTGYSKLNQLKVYRGIDLLQDSLACLDSDEIKLAVLKVRGEGGSDF